MKSTLKTIRLPEPFLKEIQAAMRKNNMGFTGLVSEAVRRYLKSMKYVEAVNQSYGAWNGNLHPELKEGTGNYVRSMRKGRSK